MTESTWNGFKRLDFSFEGRSAILVFPEKANENKNWLLKTEYFNAFPQFEIEMLKKGWHLAFVKNITRWCLDEDLDAKKRFAAYLSETYGLYEKCVPVGMSCGGLIASKFAAKYPECVSAIYLDAPVLNLLSCPAGLGKANDAMMQEFIQATGMDLVQLMKYREHPIDKMHLLLENKIPVVMVYGDSDDIVPYDENGAILEEYYRKNGGIILAIGKENCSHHPHGLTDNTPIIEFVEKFSE
ncbi:MAG: alpha/beta hydrolase [Ruminococcaceae bacterium]|nr:alpha/beta hydrolase [Oscillospiraceae bacterium]